MMYVSSYVTTASCPCLYPPTLGRACPEAPNGCYAGNKVWYTTMGAKDIIGHAISASAGSLPSKIKVGRAHDLHLWQPPQACHPRLNTCVWADGSSSANVVP